MTILQKYRGAILDTVTAFVNNPKTTPEEAANAMADAVDAQK
jgi:glucose/mannose transport system substrate-binding protein